MPAELPGHDPRVPATPEGKKPEVSVTSRWPPDLPDFVREVMAKLRTERPKKKTPT